MKKTTRVTKAKETVDIIENGCYTVADKEVIIKENIQQCISEAVLYSPEAFEPILQTVEDKLKLCNEQTQITVLNTTVLKAATQMIASGDKIGCLNFASARNPGGGFLGGAIAQEESLALSSALYGTQMANFGMYEYNRKRKTYLYSDYMIYSPQVPVFRNDDGDLLAMPYNMDIITSPAVNVGAIKNNNPAEMPFVKEAMMQRTDKVLALFAYHGIQHLLLGAWGCGVFQNKPEDVAEYFGTFLKGEGKYAKCFKQVVFAITDRHENGRNITAFKEAFG